MPGMEAPTKGQRRGFHFHLYPWENSMIITLKIGQLNDVLGCPVPAGSYDCLASPNGDLVIVSLDSKAGFLILNSCVEG